jgi:hypothetical protein
LKKVYNDTVPTTYAAYKEKIIHFDNLDQRLKAVTHHSTKKHYSSPLAHSSAPHAKTATGVYAGAGEPMDIGRNRPKAKLWIPYLLKKTPTDNKASGGASKVKCFECGKEGHMAKDCPKKREK